MMTAFQKSRQFTELNDDNDNEDDVDVISDDDDEDEEKPIYCTFAATRANPIFQSIFVCLDCTNASDAEQNGSCCLCQACAEICHAGHDVDYIGMGPSYCDCRQQQQQQSCCKLNDASNEEAVRLGLPLGGLQEHVTSPLSPTTQTNERQYIQEAFTISSLDDRMCGRLVREASELIKHCRDTHWIDLNSSSELDDNEKHSKLEELARTVLSRHIREYRLCDNLCDFQGGAEWWVQVKPVTLPTNGNQSQCDHPADGEEAVDLHYDKDEALAESFDLGSFPTLSTVTYLTRAPFASPTVVFPHTYDDDEGDVMDKMLLSFPRRGKHLVFDGRLLHGAPSHHALRQRQVDDDTCTEDNTSSTLLMNRVTFLVNVWVDRQPSGVKPLSSTIRQLIRKAGKAKKLPNIRQQQTKAIDFEPCTIESINLEREEDLPESNRDRIELPFVSTGATWISRVKGRGLVLVTFPPPPTKEDTFTVKFGPGLQAYLDYQSPTNNRIDDVRVNVNQDGQVEYI